MEYPNLMAFKWRKLFSLIRDSFAADRKKTFFFNVNAIWRESLPIFRQAAPSLCFIRFVTKETREMGVVAGICQSKLISGISFKECNGHIEKESNKTFLRNSTHILQWKREVKKIFYFSFKYVENISINLDFRYQSEATMTIMLVLSVVRPKAY